MDINSFVDELNKFIDEYNAKYCGNLPHVDANMSNVKALFELAKKYKFKTAHELLYRVTNFRIDNCASNCQNAQDCDGCCDKNCKGASEKANCKQHCNNVNCSGICASANDYIGCRQCCEKMCNINDYDAQLKCIAMCDANFDKQYSSCSDQCTDTTSSSTACQSCCDKNCNDTDGPLCQARCTAPLLNFLQNRGREHKKCS